ncbi:hypothetical protein [Staphylococcus gallinarum]
MTNISQRVLKPINEELSPIFNKKIKKVEGEKLNTSNLHLISRFPQSAPK